MSDAVIEDQKQWVSTLQPHSPMDELGYKHTLNQLRKNLLINKSLWLVVDINLVKFKYKCNNLVFKCPVLNDHGGLENHSISRDPGN
jgi:predicted Ser/Thr protein kinase